MRGARTVLCIGISTQSECEQDVLNVVSFDACQQEIISRLQDVAGRNICAVNIFSRDKVESLLAC